MQLHVQLEEKKAYFFLCFFTVIFHLFDIENKYNFWDLEDTFSILNAQITSANTF